MRERYTKGRIRKKILCCRGECSIRAEVISLAFDIDFFWKFKISQTLSISILLTQFDNSSMTQTEFRGTGSIWISSMTL
jgi:hypothetical protein